MLQYLILGGIALFAVWKAKKPTAVMGPSGPAVLGGGEVSSLVSDRPSPWASHSDIANYKGGDAFLGGGREGGGVILSAAPTGIAGSPQAPSESPAPGGGGSAPVSEPYYPPEPPPPDQYALSYLGGTGKLV